MIQLVQDILIGSLAVQHGVLLENNTEYDDCRNRLDLYLDGFVHSLMGSESKEVIAQQEGNAILRLMIEDGFPASVIASAFTSNERMQNIHKDDIHTHIETVLNKCKSIKAAYDDIKNFSVDKFDNFAQIYKKFTRERIELIGDKLLTARDDQVVAEKIYKFLEKNYETVLRRQFPDDDDRSIQEKMNTASKEIFKQIESFVKDNSLVAAEPGRSKALYAKSVVLSVQHKNKHPSFEISLSDVSKIIYNNKIRMMLARLRRSNSSGSDSDNKSHILAMLSEVERKGCLEAFRTGASFDTVEKAILSVHEREELTTDVAEIKNIINAAKNAYDLERKIISYNTLKYEENDDEKKYEDMYRYSIRRKISSYPSKISRITDTETDDEAIEFILNVNPNICNSPREKGLLCKAISECSPCAQLVSNKDEYAQAHVDKTIRAFKAIIENINSNIICSQFNDMCAVEDEGIAAGANESLKDYKDGRIVLKMLKNKMPEDRIREVISLVADITQKPDNYVDALISHGREVCRRYEVINSSGSEDDSLDARYCLFMKDEISAKDFIRSQADVEFLKEVILNNPDYDKESLIQVIRDNSPLAAEYGRDKGYAEFVQKSAEIAVKDYQDSMLKSIINDVGFKSVINGDIKKTIEEGYNKYLSALKDNKIPSTMDTDRVYFSMLLKSKNAYSGITKDIFVNKEYDIDEMTRPVKDIAKRVNDYVKERKLLEKGKAANDKIREKNRNETEA